MNKKQLTQMEVYQEIKNAMVIAGFDKANTSVVTLQLPLNDFSTKEQLMLKVNKFMNCICADSIVVIEPVIEGDGFNPFRPDYNRNRNLIRHDKFLPMYHAHIVVKLPPEEMIAHKEKWLQIVKSKKSCLFHCEPIKKDIPHLVNYITKYFELKRDVEPLHQISIEEKVVIESAATTSDLDADPTRPGVASIAMAFFNQIAAFSIRFAVGYILLLDRMSDRLSRKLDLRRPS